MRVWGLLMLALLGARSGELPERELAANPYPVAELAPSPYDGEAELPAAAQQPRVRSSRRAVGATVRPALAPSPYEFAPPLPLAPSPYDLSLAPDPYVDLAALGTELALTSRPQAPSSLRGGVTRTRRRPALAPSPYEFGPPLGLAPNPY